jgi:hypothetical protein
MGIKSLVVFASLTLSSYVQAQELSCNWCVTFYEGESSSSAVTAALAPVEPVAYSSSRTTRLNELNRPLEDLTARRGFQWRPAIAQSFTFLSIQQGVLFVSDQYALPSTHGRFFAGWLAGIRGIRSWDDGDPWLDNYVGHPLQGAITGYIQVQNDPGGRALEFANNRRYWASRLKATAYNAAYSAQFEIGPISEASIRKLGSYEYQNCRTCKVTTGMGVVDFVITPTLGLGWMLTEDMLDRYITKRYEERHGVHGVAKFLRAALSPSRSAANMLRFRAPWRRDSRDQREGSFADRIDQR